MTESKERGTREVATKVLDSLELSEHGRRDVGYIT